MPKVAAAAAEMPPGHESMSDTEESVHTHETDAESEDSAPFDEKKLGDLRALLGEDAEHIITASRVVKHQKELAIVEKEISDMQARLNVLGKRRGALLAKIEHLNPNHVTKRHKTQVLQLSDNEQDEWSSGKPAQRLSAVHHCIATTGKGMQCSRRRKYGDYCGHHKQKT